MGQNDDFVWYIEDEKKHRGMPFDNINKIIPNNIKYFYIHYKNVDIEFVINRKRESEVHFNEISLKSVGYDKRSGYSNIKLEIVEDKSEIYLALISKSEQFSGKEMVALAIMISTKLGGKSIKLDDAATVLCDPTKDDDKYNETILSIYLILSNTSSYYQKFGFKPVLQNSKYKFDPEDMIIFFHKKLKSIKIHEMIQRNKDMIKYTYEIINKGGEILEYDDGSRSDGNIMATRINTLDTLISFIMIREIYKILPKEEFLLDSLIRLYKENCSVYNFVIHHLHIVSSWAGRLFEFNVKNRVYTLDFSDIFYLGQLMALVDKTDLVFIKNL